MSDQTMISTDPRTMPLDELREVVRETYKGMRGAWLLMAVSFRRFHDENAFTKWGLESWNEYLASDLPGFEERTVQRMIQSLRYVEAREPKQLEAVLGGAPGGTPIPDYTSVQILDSLRFKAEQGAVPSEEYEAVHADLFSGQISGKEARRRVSQLSKGMRLLGSGSNDPLGDKMRTMCNTLAVVASGIRSLRRAANDGRLPFDPGRVLVDGVVRLMRSVRHAFGDEQFNALVAAAQQDERPTAAERPRKMIEHERHEPS